MLPAFQIQRAGENDLAEIMEIFEQRREWLHDIKGSDQWSNAGKWRTLMRHLIRHGNVWVLVVDDAGEEIVGTVTLDRSPDLDFWSPTQRERSAIYLSKLATAQSRAGQGLGELIMDWVADRAAREHVDVVRLDTWKTSSELQGYYATRGWRKVGMVDLGHRQSGALFERDAHPFSLKHLVVDERRGRRRLRDLIGVA